VPPDYEKDRAAVLAQMMRMGHVDPRETAGRLQPKVESSAATVRESPIARGTKPSGRRCRSHFTETPAESVCDLYVTYGFKKWSGRLDSNRLPALKEGSRADVANRSRCFAATGFEQASPAPNAK
jgi:hypothetical protein